MNAIAKRAFEICAEKGWDSDNMLSWSAAVAIAEKDFIVTGNIELANAAKLLREPDNFESFLEALDGHPEGTPSRDRLDLALALIAAENSLVIPITAREA